ncbi:MAG: electron transfer flavoprotein subunit alpha/FixB family protein [Chloroflexota bacterium]|nr:electron transfer flavoprotein subunit alpha/FixB family protein [Chloroflexota bacterium]
MDLSFLEELMGEPAGDEQAYRNVWLVAFAWNEQLRPCDVQLVGKARELADSLGAYVNVLLLGEGANEEQARELIAFGADETHWRAGYPTMEGMIDFVETQRPEFLLFSDTAGGRNIAPRLAQHLGAPLVSHAVDLMLDAENRSLLVGSPVFGNRAVQITACSGHPQIATVQPGAFPMPYRDDWREGRIEEMGIALQAQPALSRIEPSYEPVPLKSADIVIAGGRGMMEGGWQLVEELAQAFSRYLPHRTIAIAGSRGALDEGWIERHRMVDMTGQIVDPSLYIACGIRGTLQHFGAMEKSACIVAINRNPRAPILQQADFGIVGKVEEIIPALIEVLDAA